MVWECSIQFRQNGLPRGSIRIGPQVRVGEAIVPKMVEMQVTGIDGDPDALLEFAVVDGRPQCVRVEILTSDGGRALRQSDLDLSLDGLAKDAFLRFAKVLLSESDEGVELKSITSADEFDAAMKSIRKAADQPRRRVSDAVLKKVADVYLKNVDGQPVQTVMGVFGISERTAQRRIQAAERAGLLPSTTPGKKRRP